MELLTPELIRKHIDVVEATVKAHQRRSKKGKVFNVKQYERISPRDLKSSFPKVHYALNAMAGDNDMEFNKSIKLSPKLAASLNKFEKQLRRVSRGELDTLAFGEESDQRSVAKKHGIAGFHRFLTQAFDGKYRDVIYADTYPSQRYY